MTSPAPPRRGHCKLVLYVTTAAKKPVTTSYLVKFLASDPTIGRPAFELRKCRKDGTPSEDVHHVVLTERGPHCSCADFCFRTGNTEGFCKHCRSLRAVGLLRAELK